MSSVVVGENDTIREDMGGARFTVNKSEQVRGGQAVRGIKERIYIRQALRILPVSRKVCRLYSRYFAGGHG